jgi:hypothetical protein
MLDHFVDPGLRQFAKGKRSKRRGMRPRLFVHGRFLSRRVGSWPLGVTDYDKM